MAEDLTDPMQPIELLIIGGSAGSLEVIMKAFPELQNLPFAIIIVLHRKRNTDTALIDLLAARTRIPVIEAAEKESIANGNLYIAPADYHLLIESDRTFSLDFSEKINFSRPCIDVTFQTAAETYKDTLACLLLSGASADGRAYGRAGSGNSRSLLYAQKSARKDRG
jgi:two-component system chemotaxis response regulator CheB